MITLVQPTDLAGNGAPPTSPKATLLAAVTEYLDHVEENGHQHRCLTHIKNIVFRCCQDHDTGNLSYWERQMKIVMHKSLSFPEWCDQLTPFAHQVSREIQRAVPYKEIPAYHTTPSDPPGRKRLAGRTHIRV